MHEITVELATAADVDVLVELNRDVQDLHVVGEPGEFVAFTAETEPAVRDELAALIDTDDHVVLVARDGQDAVGYLVAQRVERAASPYRPAETFHYVHQIGVAPSSRGAGAGTALLAAIEAAARSHGSTRVALDHWAFNEGAARFFAARGYGTYNVRRRKRLDAPPAERPEAGLRVPERFTTPRLRLRPPVPGDAEAVYAYASDPLVTQHLPFPTHRAVDDAVAFLHYVGRGWATGTEYTWVLEFEGQVIGTCAIRESEHGVDLGYVLARGFWGRGLMTEAVTAVVDWARAQPNVHRIWAYRDLDNVASGRVLEKAGLAVEATLRRFVVMRNLSPVPRDAAVHSWTRT
ncbi:MAG TPA: GNAT family N-acetyltransferase [Egicoccus sp.]|nr:GNAT family N-acetyltransferase [Egicoccus sp.]HSK24558.1 GNAT family N-acetyltransferase [Egicoccus sp.]